MRMTARRASAVMVRAVPVVAQRQAFVGQQPAEGAFDDPAVPAQTGAGVLPDSGDAGGDAAAAEVAAHPWVVVALVPVQLERSAAGMAAAAALDARHGVQDRFDEEAVVPVGAGHQHVQREPAGVDEQVVLAAGLAAVGGVRAG